MRIVDLPRDRVATDQTKHVKIRVADDRVRAALLQRAILRLIRDTMIYVALMLIVDLPRDRVTTDQTKHVKTHVPMATVEVALQLHAIHNQTHKPAKNSDSVDEMQPLDAIVPTTNVETEIPTVQQVTVLLSHLPVLPKLAVALEHSVEVSQMDADDGSLVGHVVDTIYAILTPTNAKAKTSVSWLRYAEMV